MDNNSISRKSFLSRTLLLAPAMIFAPGMAFAQQKEKPPAIDPTIVKEFVRIAHSDFEKVKQMLEEYPLLLNASWDWGGGDYETAMNAAGHVGQKDIANYLLSKGVRADIFALTMLGKTEIVKSMLKEYPALLNSLGPHGFTLLHHAEKGGKDSEELLSYFQAEGLKETKRMLY